MKFWSWLTKVRGQSPTPESRWQVAFQRDVFEVITPEGEAQRLPVADLSGVAVETNDMGPWGADVWWLLFGHEDKLVCSFPQGATGERPIIDCLVALPDFDHEAMARAMTSTDNAVFPVWRLQKY